MKSVLTAVPDPFNLTYKHDNEYHVSETLPFIPSLHD